MAKSDTSVDGVFRDRPGEPLTTSEVADELGCSRRTAYNRLDRRADDGAIRTKKVGAKGRVWWLPVEATAPPEGDGPEDRWTNGRIRQFREQIETLIRASGDEIPDVATEIADELLELPITGVHLLNDDGERLEPAAVTDDVWKYFDEPRVYERDGDRAAGADLVWDVFDTGDPAVVEDIRDNEAFPDDDSPARSGVIYPLGDHGVFITSSPDPNAVDGTSRALAELLATSLTAALDRTRKERRLRQSKQRYRRLLETSPVPMGVFSEDDQFVFVNRAAVDFFGCEDRDSILGRSPVEFIAPEDRSRARRRLRTVVDEGGVADPVEFRFRTPDGEKRVAEVTSVPAVYESEDAGQFVIKDVTDYRRAQETIREQRRLFERAIDVIDDVFYVFDEDNRMVFWNETLPQRTGYTDDEIAKMSPRDLLPDDQWPAETETVHSVTDLGERHVELDLLTRDGERIPHEFRAVTLEDDAVGERYRVGIGRDVTERRERERELRRSKRHFEAVFDDPEQFVALLDPDGTVRQANRPALDILDAEPGDFEGRPFAETPWGNHSEELQADLREWIDRAAAGEYVEFETTLYDDGERTDFSGVVRPVTDEDGSVVSILVESRDVTERKRRQRQLRRSEQRYRRLLETSPAPILIYDTDGELQFGNDAALDLLGVDDRDQLLGTHLGEIAGDEELPFVARRHRRLVDDGEAVPPVEETLVALDGENKHVMVASAPVTFDGDDAIQTVAIDVTDRVEQRRELRRQRDRVAALNLFNEIVQETAHAVVESSTREEIERMVCERLSESAPFDGVWIGRPADSDEGIDVRVEAGETDSGSTVVGRTAAIESLETGEATAFERHRDDAPDGVGVGVPITHEDVDYGVLVAFGDSDGPVGDHGRDAISRLGDILGHAIAAAQRKAALMGQTATQLEFRSAELIEPIPELTRGTDTTITLERAVPLDETTVLYLTLSGEVPGWLKDCPDDVDRIQSVRRLEEVGDTSRFEVAIEGETVVSKVAAVGGQIESLRFADGDVTLVAQVPSGSDVRALVEAVRTDYPGLEMVAQEQVERSGADSPTSGSLDELLTDRQRAAVEAAFFAGYFEQPRQSTGAEVAEVLGVSSATFHEHLRIAERKLLDASLSSDV